METYKILIHPNAHLDIEKAYNYYFSISPKIADLFYNCIQEGYSALEINPYYQIRIKNIRAFPIAKFPYLLFFEIEEVKKTVKVLGVFNTNQNPTKWPM